MPSTLRNVTPSSDIANALERLTSLYFAHVAAMVVARDERAQKLAPPVEPGQTVSIHSIPRRDGTAMKFWFTHYLRLNADSDVREDSDRVWLTGALLAAGDLLGPHKYFGHHPEIEMIRHLRNGVAHGNRFTFLKSTVNPRTGKLRNPANTTTHPAGMNMPDLEIDTHLEGSEVLWAWGGPDAIVDCLLIAANRIRALSVRPL
jgi:hypothetical protein